MASATLLMVAIATRLAEPACLEVIHPVDRGAVIPAQSVSAVACSPDRPRAPVRFDQTANLARADAALEAGDYLGRVLLADADGFAIGDPLILSVSVGPIMVERQVFAVQRANGAERVFVRDADGHVFAAAVSHLSPVSRP